MVVRSEKQSDFTVIDNNIFRNKRLSLKARGLLGTLLSLPEDWEYSINGLENILKENETAIKSTINELKRNGYLAVDKSKNSEGKFEYTYNIYEKPNESAEIKKTIEAKVEIEEELADNFEKIWNKYPRKEGKNTAYKHYKSWLKGKKYAGKTVKLDNKQMWYAVAIYSHKVKKEQTEKQFIKMGSTFFNEAIMEYVEMYDKEPDYWEKSYL